MAGHSAADLEQPVTSAPQAQQPIVSEPSPVPQTARTQTPNNTEHISQEPPAYNETFEKSQAPSGNPTPVAQQGQGRMVTPLERLGEEPALVDCPYCKKVTTTRVAQEHSTMTVYVSHLQRNNFRICSLTIA